MASIYRWITYTLGIKKSDVPENRTVLVGNKLPVEGFVFIPQKFPDNTVKSSKYTLINFLPKNLFEQFRRIANFYFLIVALLQFIIDSPVSPVTSVLPLVFVISVTGVKQGYEDCLRHQADFEVNNRPMRVIRDGSVVDVRSMDIRVGDIVRCKTNQEFPCDIVVLSSENPEGECYVTTANLDGETNLKMHRSLPITAILQDVESLESFRGFIECEQPHTDLYKFIGRMKTFDSSGQESVLYEGFSKNLFWFSTLIYGTGFIIWNIDNIFCKEVRSIRNALPLYIAPVTQLHAWWHIFAGLGTQANIAFGITLRYRFLKKKCIVWSNGRAIPFVRVISAD